MSTAFERFANSEDRLSSLLRALPIFEAPEHMTEAFVRAARQAQSEFVGDSAAAPFFEPPPTMEAQFLREVSRIQADQAPREKAVLAQIGAGASAESVLGGRVATETARWLEARQAAKALEEGQAQATPPSKTKRSHWQWLSLRDLGLAASALVVTLFAGQWLLRDNSLTPAQTVALSPSPSTAGTASPIIEQAPAPAAAPAIATDQVATAKPALAPNASAPTPTVVARQEAGEARLSMPKQEASGFGIATGQIKEEASLAKAAPAAIAQAEEAFSLPQPHRNAEVMDEAARTRAREPDSVKKSAAAVRADSTEEAKSEPRVAERRKLIAANQAMQPAAPPVAAAPAIAFGASAHSRTVAKAPAGASVAEAIAVPPPAAAPAPSNHAFSIKDNPLLLLSRLGRLDDGASVHIRSASPAPEGMQEWLGKLRNALPSGTKLELESSDRIRGDSLEIEVLPY